MTGIPPTLLREMRQLFTRCVEFNSGVYLQTLFVDTRIKPFGNNLPMADNRTQNIDNAIAYLHDRFHRDGSNALVNLMTVLAERYQEEYLGLQLFALADRAKIPLSDVSYFEAEKYIIQSPYEHNNVLTRDPGSEKIIGTSSLRNILWLQHGIKSAQSVCRLLLANGERGTGFHIGNNMLLTNNHVLPTPVSAIQSYAEFNYQLDANGKMKVTSRYTLNPHQFRTNSALDYTLVGINSDGEHNNLDTWGFVDINTSAEPIIGEHVVIIQHPGGELKQIALTENYVKSIYPPFIRYTTDTRPGSSGAPVFNDGWQVVAIHHSSVEDQHNTPGRRQKLNEGVLIAEIIKDAGDMWPT